MQGKKEEDRKMYLPKSKKSYLLYKKENKIHGHFKKIDIEEVILKK